MAPNLAPNSAREGYVRDLRRQHKAAQQSHAAMDEGYPFMLTEARRVRMISENLIFFTLYFSPKNISYNKPVLGVFFGQKSDTAWAAASILRMERNGG